MFSFHSDNWKKNSQFPFKNWQFSTFTLFSLHSWSSMNADFCISSAYVTSGMKQSFWFKNIPTSGEEGGREGGGLNRKTTRKNMKFWPLNSYYKRSDWKTWLADRFSEGLTSKLWNKKKNRCYWSLQKSSKCVKLHSLIGQKPQNSFH